MFHPTIWADIAKSIQSDRLKEAEQHRLFSAARSASKANSAKKHWRISLPGALTSKVHNLMHPVHSSSC